MKKRLITLGAISAGLLLSTPAYALELFPGEQVTDFRVYIGNLYLFLIAAGITIATVLIMIGGVIWITSAGDGGRIQTAKSFIIDSIMGVVILLSSYFILQVINPDLVNLKPLTPPAIQIATGACYYTPEKDILERCISTTEGSCKSLPKARFEAGVTCPNDCAKFATSYPRDEYSSQQAQSLCSDFCGKNNCNNDLTFSNSDSYDCQCLKSSVSKGTTSAATCNSRTQELTGVAVGTVGVNCGSFCGEVGCRVGSVSKNSEGTNICTCESGRLDQQCIEKSTIQSFISGGTSCSEWCRTAGPNDSANVNNVNVLCESGYTIASSDGDSFASSDGDSFCQCNGTIIGSACPAERPLNDFDQCTQYCTTVARCIADIEAGPSDTIDGGICKCKSTIQ